MPVMSTWPGQRILRANWSQEFNPNSIWEVISSDGGVTFGPPKFLNTNGTAGGTGCAHADIA